LLLGELTLQIGPFVDSQHPAVDNGTLETSFEDQMKSAMQLIRSDVDPSIQVVVVPSLRDAHHDFVFPQPSFPKETDQANVGVYVANLTELPRISTLFLILASYLLMEFPWVLLQMTS
jgi:hypothetical protein